MLGVSPHPSMTNLRPTTRQQDSDSDQREIEPVGLASQTRVSADVWRLPALPKSPTESDRDALALPRNEFDKLTARANETLAARVELPRVPERLTRTP